MMNTPLKLTELGQSIWYDNIQRSLLQNGSLAGMISRSEIRGITSNPSIFMNAITNTTDYAKDLSHLIGVDSTKAFFALAIEDIQVASDLFRPIYDQTHAADGYVSLEVSPYLAYDPHATFEEAKKLAKRVNRPNLMIKIPATQVGIPAIVNALAEGININVTLIFSRKRYAQVMDAYMQGLEQRLAKGLPVDKLASVASFFVSRVDTNVDQRLQQIIRSGGDDATQANALLGKAAIANAKLAYADFKMTFSSERYKKLQTHGAHVQRPLWASTSTKNPAYRDVLYVEELIGAHTVNTVPPKTLSAFLEHGKVRLSLEEDIESARQVIADLESLGISMDEVTQQLEDEGVSAFSDAFDTLLAAIELHIQS